MSSGFGVNKHNSVKENTIGREGSPGLKVDFGNGNSFWVGSLEFEVIVVLSTYQRPMFLREVAGELDADVRRVHDALSRLLRRGFVRKVARGLYELAVELKEIVGVAVRNLPAKSIERYRARKEMELKEKLRKRKHALPSFTREPVKEKGRLLGFLGSFGSGVGGGFGGLVGFGFGVFGGFSGLFLDNVRGLVGGVVVWGDRGFVRGFGEVGGFDRVWYGEVGGFVFGVGLGGCLVVYSRSSGVGGSGGSFGGFPSCTVEWRPPAGFVGRFGLWGLARGFWEAVVLGLNALLLAVSSRSAPGWVVERAAGIVAGFLRFSPVFRGAFERVVRGG